MVTSAATATPLGRGIDTHEREGGFAPNALPVLMSDDMYVYIK